MQKAYLENYELYEFKASVVGMEKDSITLDNTYFYPGGGHQVCDTGVIVHNGIVKTVKNVHEYNDMVYHQLDSLEGLNIGDEVVCKIDKERRKYLTSLHTAQHVLSRILFNRYKINTASANFDVDGGSIVFATPLKPEWLDVINSDFKKAIKEDYKICNKVSENGVVEVSIGDFDNAHCGGTHLSKTSELECICILGIGRKHHVLMFDAFSNIGNLKKYLEDYYLVNYMLGFEGNVYQKVSLLVDEHNSLLDEFNEICMNSINELLKDKKNIFEHNNYKISLVSLEGQELTKKAYRKLVKKAEYVYDGIDLCVIAIDNQLVLDASNINIDAKAILEELKKEGISIVKGGGSSKRVNVIIDSTVDCAFDAIRKIVKGL